MLRRIGYRLRPPESVRRLRVERRAHYRTPWPADGVGRPRYGPEHILRARTTKTAERQTKPETRRRIFYLELPGFISTPDWSIRITIVRNGLQSRTFQAKLTGFFSAAATNLKIGSAPPACSSTCFSTARKPSIAGLR